MVYQWELDKLKNWSENELRNWIWLAVANNQPIPGYISVEALRTELSRHGLSSEGYHNT